MNRPSSSQPKSAHLQTLVSLTWPLFLTWTALAFLLLPLGIGLAEIDRAITNPGLKEACAWITRWFDLIWILLATAALHLHTMQREGLATARKVAFLLIGGVTAVMALGVATGFPFGPLRFTDKLGWRAVGVPIGVPLLGYLIFLSARYSFPLLWPATARSRRGVALGSAGLALLTLLNLEPEARRARYYWGTPVTDGSLFSAWPPPQAWLAWFALPLLLILLLPPLRSGPVADQKRPLILFLLINAVFLAMKLPLSALL